jgi:G3E family GTPase
MLVARRKEFDCIILETTGLADPSPIIFTFNNNAIIQDNYRLDSVVCLVDTKHINIHLDDKKPDGNINEAENQIAFSDRIILNKLDLVSEEEIDDVVDRIRSMNSFATIIKTVQSRAPLDQVLGLNTFSLDALISLDPTFMDEDDDGPSHDHGDSGHVHDEHCGHDTGHVHDEHCGHDTGHVHDEHCGHDTGHVHDEHCGHDTGHVHDEHCGHDTGHDHHDHSQKKKKKTHNLSLVSSVGFTIHGLLDVPKFNAFMSGLLAARAADIYRSKGVLAFADQGDTKFVFQGVHEQINFGPTDKPWEEGVERVSKMVFIGKNLDPEYFKNSLLESTRDPANSSIKMHKRA